MHVATAILLGADEDEAFAGGGATGPGRLLK